MNIKDRLKNTKVSDENIITKKEDSKKEDILELFADGKYVQTLVYNYIKDHKNIIFLVNSSFDDSIICEYFKSFTIKSEKVKITNTISLNEAQINIIPHPTIKETVKIFENIICSDKSYIFGFKINNFDNILGKFKALISVNFPNMTQESIDILINSSQCAIVYFSKNDDGLYFISKIEEIHNIEGEINLEKVFDNDSAFVLSDDNIKNEKSETEDEVTSDTEQIDENSLLLDNNTNNNEKEHSEEEKQIINVDNNRTIKVNKYKLLKEKIRKRKESI